MRDFARSGGRLAALPFPARLVYSVFLLFTLIALVFSAWLGAEMVGPNLGKLDEYYAGKSPARAPEGAGHVDGPSLDMPADLLGPAEAEAMPLRKLLEVTHFHLFSMPVYLMILSHLFMLTGLGLRAKITWLSLSSFAVALHIAAPWIARSDTSSSALVYGGSGALLAVTFLVLGGVPLVEMWKPRSGASDGKEHARHA